MISKNYPAKAFSVTTGPFFCRTPRKPLDFSGIAIGTALLAFMLLPFPALDFVPFFEVFLFFLLSRSFRSIRSIVYATACKGKLWFG